MVNYPDFDRTKFTDHPFPKFVIWHWVLNPGLAFNELVLGQRIPKVMLLDKTSDAPIYLRTYVPCPHCGSIHPSMLWSKGNALGHWYGYLCPTCGQIIPCLQNWTSRAISAVTYPLWVLPSKWLKPRWLAYEKTRLNRKAASNFLTPVKPAQLFKRALIGGICWGLLMWLAMDVVPFLRTYNSDISSNINFAPIVYGFPICLAAGLIWGICMGTFMQLILNRKGNKVGVSATSSK